MKIKKIEIKNASAGNRTRVDSLEGYNSTSKLLMLLICIVLLALIFKKQITLSQWMALSSMLITNQYYLSENSIVELNTIK